jgi:hypothetical protein
MAAPAYTKRLQLQIMITGCTMKDYLTTGYYYTEIEMAYVPGAVSVQRIPLPFEIKKDSITVVAVALRYTVFAIILTYNFSQ